MFDVLQYDTPVDIQNRIKHSKRYSEWQKAREDARLSYENEMSARIAAYTASRQSAKSRADSFGKSNLLLNHLIANVVISWN